MVAEARRCLAVVLAAGEGTRMRSATPKVLHRLAGRSMLAHVLAAVAEASAEAVVVVVGPGRDDVAAEARRAFPGAEVAVQAERLGTAHAVLAARDAIARGYDDVLVLFADVPLIAPGTLAAMRDGLAEGAGLVALGFSAADPTGYGRLLTRDGALVAIREHKDASAEERAVTLCFAGPMAFDGATALDLLGRIGCDNAQGEFYLTEAVELTRADGRRCLALSCPERDAMGVNDRVQLAAAEAAFQARLRLAAMRAGVTLQAPDTVFLSHDTAFGRDVTVEPHVVFGPGVSVAEGAVIHAFSHLEGARVGPQANVGPHARLRPGAVLGQGAKVGNFVEVKSADIGAGAKVSHLSYIGDASIGADANIGAGTITCNYDGYGKFHTAIGAGAFIGSNSALVAPVSIGRNAYVASGSTVTEDVPEDALAIGRARQTTKAGRGAALRAARAAAKAARQG
ncbi:bifunctional UDP-N-acetylglucosamine diphosphorylase/glucosamine-1-phosphate N-acetyltransferase GlmU [Lichenibacterium ramalinae]|uniref:Bifunctional protein GlmU n=1 Tax=Lichenibacterium ramalinae TaxID=2316527 RepID=A0A4Q2R9Q1_9HYPH|nr:bifunctional UDP-N-acetylglucosamine diphosphorylase/glucosamine-1-phosphate N-acetyltransferase GlmU [Lichenibacterium ramalinae]RYB03415.1 bifunctional UDP-N-acetylglucosamine diphosphorylase/glucosamine-1-phosphate N-acetyltransferase GlmU [Lichenibacterium ramalinae]